MPVKKHKSFQRPKSGRKTKTALLMGYFVEKKVKEMIGITKILIYRFP